MPCIIYRQLEDGCRDSNALLDLVFLLKQEQVAVDLVQRFAVDLGADRKVKQFLFLDVKLLFDRDEGERHKGTRLQQEEKCVH